jgi:hypothetical protein
MIAAPTSTPEQGQLVRVRSRNWIVNEVVPSPLPESPVRGLINNQTLVSLSSVEDDGLGEELEVIWELEPGTRINEKVALPDPTGFDPPDQLDARDMQFSQRITEPILPNLVETTGSLEPLPLPQITRSIAIGISLRACPTSRPFDPKIRAVQ